MILECGECGTRYLVPDTAIGAAGRTVRCANCKHSWFQAPEAADLATRPALNEAQTAPEPAPEPRPEPRPAPRIVREAPEPAEPAARPIRAEAPRPAAEAAPKPAIRVFEDEKISGPAPAQDRFAARAGSRRKPRRNPARRWTAAAAVAGASMLLGAGAILYSGAPGIAAQLGLGIGGEVETPLRFTDKNVELRTMPNGSQVFAVSGKVVNPSGGRQHVPDIRVELRDGSGRLVYSWRITPGLRELDPKGALDFNAAKVDLPSNARVVELSFASETGA